MPPLDTWGYSASYWIAIWLMGNIILVECWDLYMLIRGRPELTVSWVLRDWSRETPLIPLVVGLLVGHLFWK